jgi:hypothetical protein
MSGGFVNVKEKVVVKYAWEEEKDMDFEVYQESDQNELNEEYELAGISKSSSLDADSQ